MQEHILTGILQTMKDLKIILTAIGLFLTEWVVIVFAYIIGVYELTAFRSVFLDISSWNVPEFLRSLVMIVWAGTPIVGLGAFFNSIVLQLPKKLFWYLQGAFLISVWISLTVLILIG